MKKTFSRSLYFLSAFLIAASFLGFVSQSYHAEKAQAAASTLAGYAWSDNIGWISFSGTSPSYGVSEDSSGNLTGYAWSDNIGWIKFGGLSGFPSGTGTSNENAVIDSSGNMHGWVLACAGTVPGDCSSMTSRTDGWDGWISLDGSSYGVDFSSGNGQYGQNAYTWGSDVVGWVNFNPTLGPASSTNSSCNPAQEVCGGSGPTGLTPSVSLSVSPTSIATGTAATLSWNTSNITSCNESSSGINTDSNWSGTLTPNATSSSFGTKSTSAFNTTGTETYNLTCTATAQAGGGQISAAPITLTVTASASQTGPSGSICLVIPTNAILCPASSANGVTSSLVGSQPLCAASGAVCQFYCPSNYHQVGNECVGNGTIQEQ